MSRQVQLQLHDHHYPLVLSLVLSEKSQLLVNSKVRESHCTTTPAISTPPGAFAGAVGEVATVAEFEGQRATLHHDASHQYPLLLSLVLSGKSQRWLNSKVRGSHCTSHQNPLGPGTFACAVTDVAKVGEFEGQRVTLQHDASHQYKVIIPPGTFAGAVGRSRNRG